jgi:hypothetical protein
MRVVSRVVAVVGLVVACGSCRFVRRLSHSYRGDMRKVCDAVDVVGVTPRTYADGDALRRWSDDNIAAPDAVRLFYVLERIPTRRGRAAAIRSAAREAGVTTCPAAERLETTADATPAPAAPERVGPDAGSAAARAAAMAVGGLTSTPGAAGAGASSETADITPRLRAHIGPIRACYELALRRNPTLAGRVVVQFTVGRDGRVVGAPRATGLERAPDVGRCVAARIAAITFAPRDGEPTEFSYPFVFSPGE